MFVVLTDLPQWRTSGGDYHSERSHSHVVVPSECFRNPKFSPICISLLTPLALSSPHSSATRCVQPPMTKAASAHNNIRVSIREQISRRATVFAITTPVQREDVRQDAVLNRRITFRNQAEQEARPAESQREDIPLKQRHEITRQLRIRKHRIPMIKHVVAGPIICAVSIKKRGIHRKHFHVAKQL